MAHDVYESPLVSRNASEEMAQLFSPQRRIGLWRRLWLAVAEAQHELGLPQVTDAALAQMRERLDDVDFANAAVHERRLRHDVMAHVHAFGDVAPLARPILHLGLTSADVTDNVDLILMRQGLRLLCDKLAGAIARLAAFAHTWRDEPTLGYTHFQPAQLTTIGKRACLWLADLCGDLTELERQADGLRLKGIKGATGTQAAVAALFGGHAEPALELERRVAAKLGFAQVEAVAGQTYSRKVDAHVVNSLAQVAVSAHKWANDLRLLQHLRQVEEPFEDTQVGSSAMAYKRNPMRMERATGLARFVLSLASSPLQTAAEQWLERTLDDSSNRRLAIPEAFLATDGILLILLNVAGGMVVHVEMARAAVRQELPFMATEEILMAGVQAGGDRQDLHEAIRHASQEASAQVKLGMANDLLHRLAQSSVVAPLLTSQRLDLATLTDPRRFVGLCSRQVDDFLSNVVNPLLLRYPHAQATSAELKV